MYNCTTVRSPLKLLLNINTRPTKYKILNRNRCIEYWIQTAALIGSYISIGTNFSGKSQNTWLKMYIHLLDTLQGYVSVYRISIGSSGWRAFVWGSASIFRTFPNLLHLPCFSPFSHPGHYSLLYWSTFVSLDWKREMCKDKHISTVVKSTIMFVPAYTFSTKVFQKITGQHFLVSV